MTDTIKTAGVRLTIDGQAEFLQNIKVVNQELRQNYQELRLVREQQKLQGTTTENLAQKGKILASEYDNQTAKLKGLEQAIEQATKEYGIGSEEVEKLTTAYKRAEVGVESLRRQVFYNTIELEKSKSGMYQAGVALDDFGQKAIKVGDRVNKVGTTMTVSLTAPIMAGAAYAIKSANDLETAMIGVQKTTDMAGAELKAMENQFRDLSKEIPTTAAEIANVAEVAGQLGVQKENIVDFTKVIIDMGNSTNIAGEQGAAAMAKFANVTGMSQSNFDRFGSAIVELGNNLATTENDVLNMATRLASAGAQAGLSEADILGISAALSSLGIEAQAGGTAFSKMITRLQLAVETGSEDLDSLAAVAGMTGEQFKKSFQEDAAGALVEFISGLGNFERHGKSASQILVDLEIKEDRLSDALRRTAGSGDLLSDAIEMGNTAWKENTALVEEAGLKYSSSESQIQIAKNRLQDTAITIGQNLLPHVVNLAENISELVEKFNDLNPQTQELIIKMLGIAAAAGPVLKVGGTLIKGVGTLTSGIGELLKKLAERSAVEAATTAIEGMGGAVGKATAEAAGMSSGLSVLGSAIAGPIGVTVGVVGLVAAIATLIARSQSASAEIQALRDKAEKAAETFNESKAAATANAESVIFLTDRLYNLADVESKTTQQKAEMRSITEQVNKIMGQSVLVYDEASDSLNKTKIEVQELTEAFKEQLIVEATQEAMEEYLDIIGDTGSELRKAKKSLSDMETAVDDVHTTYNDLITSSESFAKLAASGLNLESLGKQFPVLGTAVTALADEIEKTGGIHNYTYESMIIAANDFVYGKEKEVADLQEILDEAEKNYNDNAEIVKEKYAEIDAASQETADGQVDDFGRVGEAALQSVEDQELAAEQAKELQEFIKTSYDENYGKIEDRAREHYQSMGGIEDEGIKQSEVTAAQVRANLQQQIEDFKYWRENIQGLAGRVPNDVLFELQKLGPQYAPLISELNGMTKEQLDQWAATWQEKSQLSVDSAVEEFDLLPGHMSDSIDSIANILETDKKVQAAVISLTQAMLKIWEEAGRETAEVGKEVPKNVAYEIETGRPLVESSSFITGKFIGSKMQSGILSNEEGVHTAGKTLGTQANAGAKTGLGSAFALGSDWALGVVAGVKAQNRTLYNQGMQAASQLEMGYRSKAEIRSPSKVAYRAATDTVMGLLNRFKEAERELFNAGQNLASATDEGYNSNMDGIKIGVGRGGSRGVVNEYNVTNYIQAPVELTEREAARQMKNALKELAYAN